MVPLKTGGVPGNAAVPRKSRCKENGEKTCREAWLTKLGFCTTKELHIGGTINPPALCIVIYDGRLPRASGGHRLSRALQPYPSRNLGDLPITAHSRQAEELHAETNVTI